MANEQLCSPHPCRRQDTPCTNFKHSKSKGLCAKCFNHGCVADVVSDHSTHIVAENVATAVMDYDYCRSCGTRRCCGTPSYWHHRDELVDLVAENVATAVVRTPVPIPPDRAEELAAQLDVMAACAESGLDLTTYECGEVAVYLRAGIAAQADLARLCGPVCEHDQKRAVEHVTSVLSGRIGLRSRWCAFHHHRSGLCGRVVIGHDASVDCAGEPSHNFDGVAREPHPPSPAIEAWLRERAK